MIGSEKSDQTVRRINRLLFDYYKSEISPLSIFTICRAEGFFRPDIARRFMRRTRMPAGNQVNTVGGINIFM
jgi:hypothetical protein